MYNLDKTINRKETIFLHLWLKILSTETRSYNGAWRSSF